MLMYYVHIRLSALPRFALQGKSARMACSNTARNPVFAYVPCLGAARDRYATVSLFY